VKPAENPSGAADRTLVGWSLGPWSTVLCLPFSQATKDHQTKDHQTDRPPSRLRRPRPPLPGRGYRSSDWLLPHPAEWAATL